MGLIYQYVEQVIIYLGEASDGNEELPSLMEAIYSKVVDLPF